MAATRIIGGVVAMALVLLMATPAEAADPDLIRLAEDWASERMDQAHVPGLVVAVVEDGEARFLALGDADPTTGRPMTPEIPLRLGSISKPVTATLALGLASDGVVDLDRPVDAYLHADLSDRLGPASTIRQLLQHRGGYPDVIVGTHHPDRPAPDLARWVHGLGDRSLAPGVVASYSSVGYTLAGAALEAATGRPFAELAEERVFDPLGMDGASFEPAPPADVAVGHRWTGERLEAFPLDTVELQAGVALTGSGRDMAAFMAGVLDEQGPLPEEVRRGLLEPAGPGWGLRPHSTGLTEWRSDAGAAWYHEGNGIGTTSRMALLPDRGIGVFAAVNGEALDGLGGPSSQTEFLRGLHEVLLGAVGGDPSRALADAGAGTARVAEPGRYVPTRVDPDSVLRLEALVDQFEVRVDGDAAVLGDDRFLRTDDTSYVAGARRVVFIEGPDTTYATFGGTSSYRIAEWWETLPANVVALAVALVALLGGSFAVFVGRPDRWLVGTTAVTSVGAVAMIGLLGLTVAGLDVMAVFTGPTPGLVAAAVAGWVVAVGAAATAVAAVMTDRGRVAGLTVATGAAVIAGWAAVWQVLGV